MAAPRGPAVTAAELADRLGGRRRGAGWQAKCPAHDDRQASLSISAGDGERVLIHCHAGCEADAVTAAMGLTMEDLMPARPSANGTRPTPGAGPARGVTRHMICDAEGNALAVHARIDKPDGKDIWWERPDGAKGLPPLLKPDRLLYGLELLDQRPGDYVVLAEGEKATDALRAVKGLVVLGTVGGAAVTPNIAVLEHLRGRRVYLWPDNDAEGRRHMDRIALILRELGCEVLMIAWDGAPAKGDAADCSPQLYAELIASAKPWEAPTPETSTKAVRVEGDSPWLEGGHLPRTDLGNSERFVAQHGADLWYVPEIGWYAWTGRVWARNDAAPYQRARQTVRALYQEAADEPDKYLREGLAAWAKASESTARIAAIVTQASTDPKIVARVEDFDQDKWVFNCLNGTIDLRTGKLRPHRREDLITMMAPVEFDPEAKFEPWDRFLGEATGGDADLANYLQRCTGYSITGEVSHDEFYVLHGPGGTGKSTFIGSIQGVMGPYSTTLRTEAVSKGNSSGGHNEDIARLRGKRLVVMVEASERDQLREGLIKQLTGGDRISASFKGKPGFEFDPILKLWLASNHVPRMPVDDSGMERRFRKVPFEHKPREADPALRYSLRNDPVARAAVLAWIVRGCLAYQLGGLRAPACVTVASKGVFDDQNPLTDFFADCLEFDPNLGPETDAGDLTLRESFAATAGEIYARYLSWADAEHLPPRSRVTQKAIANSLQAKGCTSLRTGHAKHREWVGVRMRPDAAGCGPVSEEGSTYARGGSYTESGPDPAASGRRAQAPSSDGPSGPATRPDGTPYHPPGGDPEHVFVNPPKGESGPDEPPPDWAFGEGPGGPAGGQDL